MTADDTKYQSNRADATSKSVTFPMVGIEQFETMLRANQRVFQNLQRMNNLWAKAVQDATASGTELSARLMRASPQEAASICNGWLQERATQFVATSQEATQLWIGLCGSAAGADDSSQQDGAAAHSTRSGSTREAA